MWLDQVDNFKSLTRRSFGFLTETEGFDEPYTDLTRDLCIDFEQPESGWRVSVGWERSWFVPFISLDATHSLETATHQLTYLLRLLNVSVDAGAFPYCGKLSRNIVPGLRSLWTHFRNRRAILDENPAYLEAHAEALRRHYDALWELTCDPATPVWQLRL